MQKLEPQNQIQISQGSLAAILSSYSITEFTFHPIDQGIANVSSVIESAGKKYVLRVYAQNRKSDEDILLEIRFQDYLREHGLPIPLLYPNNSGEELNITELTGQRWQSILMEFMEGQSVTLHPSPELIADLARAQARMHLLGMEFAEKVGDSKKPWTELRDSLAKKMEKLPLDMPDVLGFVERVRSYSYILDPDLPQGYNHLDIDFDGNVLTKDNKVSGIVDFDDLSYSPAIVCLGYSLWNILDDEGPEAMRRYLEEYGKVRPLNTLEREALPHVIFFRNYVIGIVRLLFWDDATDIKDITDILRLEKEIPSLTF